MPGSQIDNPPLGMIVSNLRSLPRLLSLNQLARRLSHRLVRFWTAWHDEPRNGNGVSEFSEYC